MAVLPQDSGVILGQILGMENIALHIVGGDSRARAEQARIAFSTGYHAEIYADLDELLNHPPRDGLLLMADDSSPAFPATTIDQLAARGVWLPMVVTSTAPSTERAVAAIKGGALDYFALPLEAEVFARRLSGLVQEAVAQASARRRMIEARGQMSRLSRREGEVLELLSAGSSNKEIARHLEISPRTVEIHRANMMNKLGAHHAADAIRTWLDARDAVSAIPLHNPDAQEGGNLAGGTIGLAAMEDLGIIR